MISTSSTGDCVRASFERLARTITVLTGGAPVPATMRQFRQYLDLLVRWNRSQRLTGARSPAAIVEELFEDSMLFLLKLPSRRLKVADLGAGAGIPGVPLAIVRPDLSVTLIESKRKRVSFLLALKRELDVTNIEVLEGRAEKLIDATPGLRGAFDVVVSRSAGPIVTLLPIAMSYLATGGSFVGAGSPSSTPLEQLDELGISREALELPAIGRRRAFLVATKGEGA